MAFPPIVHSIGPMTRNMAISVWQLYSNSHQYQCNGSHLQCILAMLCFAANSMFPVWGS